METEEGPDARAVSVNTPVWKTIAAIGVETRCWGRAQREAGPARRKQLDHANNRKLSVREGSDFQC